MEKDKNSIFYMIFGHPSTGLPDGLSAEGGQSGSG